jgi:methylenetetrahydrofolate dehydrogenase (NADP+)/methenyltetrahydrofolate cyclohydrolase/formyltetrahydrofolate synthetase
MLVDIKRPVPSDIEIAQEAKMRPIIDVAQQLGLTEDDLDYYGKYKAKVHLDVLNRLADRPNGKYIDVTAITPTPLGEGKTVTTIGVSQGLDYIGKKVMTCIRQPSQGPTFGIKGGAAGGGYSQIVSMEDFNLHLTGDIHAVSAAHNLLAAAMDNRLTKELRWSTNFLAKALCPNDEYTPSMRVRLGKLGIQSEKPSDLSAEDKERMFRLDIDPYTIQWRRIVDVSDASLRNIIVGLGTVNDGTPRQSGYDISVASEIMAALALCSGIEDLRARMGRIIIGTNKKGDPITAEDLNVAGAMTVLLKEAIMPNLMQTLAGSPAFVHCGPFANIAQGNSSILADRIALKLMGADGYVVTESGFGADCGMEKFFDIKCRASGLVPNCVVLVCTVRALKMHGGGPKVVAGKPLDKAYTAENLELLEKGLPNLLQHIENALKFGVPVVVAINRFKDDTDAEIQLIRKRAQETGAEDAVWADGAAGGAALAEAVVQACEKPSNFKFLYADDLSIKEKIETIACEIYRAGTVTYTAETEEKIKAFTKMGLSHLPLCMAKTHLSFTHDASVKGAPRNWTLPITDIRASVGAGFLYPLCGTMRTMPGLPTRPAFTDVDLDLETGRVVGLF